MEMRHYYLVSFNTQLSNNQSATSEIELDLKYNFISKAALKLMRDKVKEMNPTHQEEPIVISISYLGFMTEDMYEGKTL